MKIMTVDDSLTMRTIIAKAVTAIGAEVVQAENGKDALEKLTGSENDADLVLLDWNMPEMNGYDTLVKIKETESISHIPVIMVTTQAERTNVLAAVQVGAVGYVTKPFDPQVLLSKIKKVMNLE